MKAVEKYLTLDGEDVIYGQYKSASEAARSMHVTGVCHILKCCHGLLDKAYGFCWRFRDSDIDYCVSDIKRVKRLQKEYYDNKVYTRRIPYFTIEQRNLQDMRITVWRSVQDACKALGIKNSPQIYDCLKGRVSMAAGYKWYYINDSDFKL